MARAADKPVNDTPNEKVELATKLKKMYPGQYSVAVGGSINEGIIEGAEVVSIPTTDDGLPKATEVLYGGWTSKTNATYTLEKGKKSLFVGRFHVPIIVNGEVKEVQGSLQALRAGSGAKWTFNMGVKSTYTTTNDAGEETEGVKYPQPWLVPNGVDGFNALRAAQMDWCDMMGKAIALQHDIWLTVEH